MAKAHVLFWFDVEDAHMALDLGRYLVYGELLNTRRNSVHGWLGLEGMDCKLHSELTGNCEPDLQADYPELGEPDPQPE